VFSPRATGAGRLLRAGGRGDRRRALVNVTAAAAWAAGAAEWPSSARLARCLGLEDWRAAGSRWSASSRPCHGVLTEAARTWRRGVAYGADVGRLKARRAVGAPMIRRALRDVDACLRLDTTKLVPRYVPERDKIVGDHG